MRFAALFLSVFALAQQAMADPVRLIFDTDMGNDIDDALALAVIHSLESRGEAKLLAVTLTKDNKFAAPFVDLVNHFYGRGSVPIGVVKNGSTPNGAPMIQWPAEKKDEYGLLAYPRRLMSGADAPEAVEVLMRVLAAQPDNSVVMVQVGFSTNLARLLTTPGGRELVTKKVRLLSTMAGHFPAPGEERKAEYNVKIDLPASTALFRDWPTPVVASGWEIGDAVKYPAISIEQDFNYVRNHPVADSYRHYKQMPYDRPTWDLTAVLYAVRPERGYFGLSESGTIVVDDEGKTLFRSSATGRHRYLTLNAEQRAKTLEALIQLSSQPPDNINRH
ncbi:MAG: nucleoside hydrolase [Acidobacteriota bacterium]